MIINLENHSFLSSRGKELYAKDLDAYERDYSKYKDNASIKPHGIGKPFILGRGEKFGVLLVHGYKSNPEEVRLLAEYLHGKGFSIYAVRLPGSGTSPEDLHDRECKEWFDSVERGRKILLETTDNIAICGLSLGGAISLIESASKKKNYRAVISLSSPYRIINRFASFAYVINIWNKFFYKLNLKALTKQFLEDIPDNPDINYFSHPITGVIQVLKIIKKLKQSLAKINIPVLIIQGKGDQVIHKKSPFKIYEKVSSINKEMHILDTNQHCIIRGKAAEKVFPLIYNFLKTLV